MTFSPLYLSSIILLLASLMASSCGIPQKLAEINTATDSTIKVAWAARRDIDSDQFYEWFDNYSDQGYIIKDIDAYGNTPQYSMIWEENKDNRGWAAWRNLSSESYNNKWEAYHRQGWRPTDIEGYTHNGQTYYAGIWEENIEGWEWESNRNMSSASFSERNRQREQAGMRLVDFEAYEKDGQIVYAGIWYENVDNLQWAAYHDMDWDSYQRRIDDFSNRGYKVIDFESYSIDRQQYYAAIWVKNVLNRKTVVRSDRSEADYANYFKQYLDEGYRLVDFECYNTRNGVRYAGVWTENNPALSRYELQNTLTQAIQQYQTGNNVAGISEAVAKNGNIVYQRGFGEAHKSRNINAYSGTVYLLASISKVIGGTLAAKMESEGRLSDGTVVQLDMTQPTTSYINIPASGHTHTVQQLYAHTGCIWHYSNGPEPPTRQYDTALEALQEIWNRSPISGCNIGQTRNYSTHAHTFIAAVLEQVSNRSITRLVEEEIAQQYGLRSMRVMYKDGDVLPDNNRAKPYTKLGLPRSIANNSWKVLGGGIESNVVDLAKFGAKHLTGDIISPTVRDTRLWVRQPNSTNGIAWSIS